MRRSPVRLAFRWAACLAACLVAGVSRAASDDAAAVVGNRQLAREEYAARLEELAQSCDANGLVAEATETRSWAPTTDTLSYFVALPATSFPFQASGAAPDALDWRSKFDELRRQQAEVLFALAARAADAELGVLAFELAAETLRENPEHEAARRAMGYERFEEQWLTPFEVSRHKAGQVWHARFGWLPKDHVAQYEAGQRYYRGRWMPAASEAALRGDIERGWEVFTEHYHIGTNHSLETGVELATKLERLYDAWRLTFARFYTTDEALSRRFKNPTPLAVMPRRMKVLYYRTRDEYVAALRRVQPQIGITTGYYLNKARQAFFYVDGEAAWSNVYHEATHQLFSETKRVSSAIGREQNFWIVEGIACYMESMAEGPSSVVLGGSAPRLAAARHRLIEDRFYVPLAQFTTLGMERLQRDPRIAMLYSQAAGLTHFFMHADRGRYRQPLVDYLSAVYASRDRAGTLAEVTKQSTAALDQQYAEFIGRLARAVESDER